MSELIWKIDAWIMARHQWMADRIYSRFGLSPYEISANVFGAIILANLAYWGIKFSVQIADMTAMNIIFAFAGFVVPSMWFWIALEKHRRYVRTKTAPTTPMDDFFRILICMPLLPTVVVGLVILLFPPDWLLVREVTFALEISAFYFYGCNAPTLIERKEKKLEGKFAESMG